MIDEKIRMFSYVCERTSFSSVKIENFYGLKATVLVEPQMNMI